MIRAKLAIVDFRAAKCKTFLIHEHFFFGIVLKFFSKQHKFCDMNGKSEKQTITYTQSDTLTKTLHNLIRIHPLCGYLLCSTIKMLFRSYV